MYQVVAVQQNELFIIYLFVLLELGFMLFRARQFKHPPARTNPFSPSACHYPVVICFIVFTRPTHTNVYLHSESHHHPSNILALLSALSHTARPPCGKENLHDELEFLMTTLRENDSSIKQISCAFNPAVRTSKPTDSPPQSLFHMSRRHTAVSAECWPNATLNVLDCRMGMETSLSPP
jgi:hypothetical protein